MDEDCNSGPAPFPFSAGSFVFDGSRIEIIKKPGRDGTVPLVSCCLEVA